MNHTIMDCVGNTPLIRIDQDFLPNINLYAKLEFYNPTGSVKDRAASYIIENMLKNGEINQDTTLIESSSGNFGIALAATVKKYNLRFICVIDPHINHANEMLIRSLGAEVIKVNTPDQKGGYLLERIRIVQQLHKEIPNSYWINQYGNPYNAAAYYHSLGEEICREMNQIDYVFVGVSSGGTITGISKRIKEKFPDSKIIAVDIIGSVIFGGEAKKRYIPGIGSSMVPKILDNAIIDDVVMVDELSTIEMCHELLNKYCIFAGGSSGSVLSAMKIYFSERKYFARLKEAKEPLNIVTIFPDRGDRYMNTIYNEEWTSKFKKNLDLKMIEVGV